MSLAISQHRWSPPTTRSTTSLVLEQNMSPDTVRRRSGARRGGGAQSPPGGEPDAHIPAERGLRCPSSLGPRLSPRLRSCPSAGPVYAPAEPGALPGQEGWLWRVSQHGPFRALALRWPSSTTRSIEEADIRQGWPGRGSMSSSLTKSSISDVGSVK